MDASRRKTRKALNLVVPLTTLTLLIATFVEASQSDFASSCYSKVLNPTLDVPHLEDLPGFTRSVVEKDHALITVESQVFSPLPGWTNSQAAYLITPAIGSHFSMLLVRMAAGAKSALPSPGVERFLFVLHGDLSVESQPNEGDTTAGSDLFLGADNFAYFPPFFNHSLSTFRGEGATLIVIERLYSKLHSSPAPELSLLWGSTNDRPLVEVPGEVFALRKLLPTGPSFDFNIHVMDFNPGEYLNVKEVHYNQHGLILLEGRGIYRLGEKWYPVQSGDVIWMAPFVPQWYAALGKNRSRYLLYKDVNRDPLLAS